MQADAPPVGANNNAAAAKKKRKGKKKKQATQQTTNTAKPKPAEAQEEHYRTCTTDGCGKKEDPTHKFSQCSKCGLPYCSRECQLKDWKVGSHKGVCSILAPAKPTSPASETSLDPQVVVRDTLRKFIQYISPFAIFGFQNKGHGVVYLETGQSLGQYQFDGSKDDKGNQLDRQLKANYFTVEELEKAIPAEKKEALTIGDVPLAEAVKAYKVRSELIVVFHSTSSKTLVCMKTKLVPDYQKCRAQCNQFESISDALVINLDRD